MVKLAVFDEQFDRLQGNVPEIYMQLPRRDIQWK